MTASALPPGSTIGILGAGQLGRMLTLAAARLGLKCHVYSDVPGPAADVAAALTIAPFDDLAALDRFAETVHAVTLEFENVPVTTLQHLARHVPVRPGAKALAIAQDRLAEKQLVRDLGALTADFATVETLDDLRRAIETLGLPLILKTRRFGYDGKGQVKILQASDAQSAWNAVGQQSAIVERIVPFAFEASIIAARGLDGAFVAYDIPENVHRNHILDTSTVPSRLTPRARSNAIDIARKIGTALDYVGVFAVEFFVEDFSREEVLRVNEIAPRVHNSGHWTLEACAISQFENQIRAAAGWPLGDPRRHADAIMTNLIGSDAHAWQHLAAQANVGLHIYGKNDARDGRKMGHTTELFPLGSRTQKPLVKPRG